MANGGIQATAFLILVDLHSQLHILCTMVGRRFGSIRGLHVKSCSFLLDLELRRANLNNKPWQVEGKLANLLQSSRS